MMAVRHFIFKGRLLAHTFIPTEVIEKPCCLVEEGWRLHHFPGQPVPMLDNPLGEEKFPNIQSKPPLAQLEAISSRPVTCYLGEETDPHLSTTSFQAKQPQLPQLLLIRLLLQTLHQLRCPSLDTLQHLNVPLVVGGPKLNTVFEVSTSDLEKNNITRITKTDFTGLKNLRVLSRVTILEQHLCLLVYGHRNPQKGSRLREEGEKLALVMYMSKIFLGVTFHGTQLVSSVQVAQESDPYTENSSQNQGLTAWKRQSQEDLAGWRLNHFPGQHVPMLDNPFSEVKFPNIQSKPPLVQPEAISSCPITCYLGEETDTHLSTTSFQVVVESNKVSPQPPFLQAKQPQFPQPLLIRLLLQTLHQLCCPSLHTLQHLNVSLVVGGPKLNTVFEGHDHFPSPAGHAIFDTSQDAIGFLGHRGTLLAHIQVVVSQHPQVLFCLAAFQPLFPKPVALHGAAVAQVQDLALGLVKPHTIDLGPSIQPVQVPLQSLPTLQQINTPSQLGVICKITEGALDPFVQIIDKDIKQNWPQHRALGNTACDWPPAGVNSIHHHSLGLAIQPVLYPAKSTPVQAMSSQFLQENAVGNCVKGFTEV
ncbi:hypothetical protein QYF61_001833 [Mycteria americana]|uniref:Uncharacterized protein n=1 Tax=Mycteria americana TaxID=33587 RepID=A0AAN7RNH4_MYCAM|nr:hypothetical protein QYF61_001833 [Mycteria americana]